MKNVDHAAAVGIIYRRKNPEEIFIEVKDDGHPLKLVRRCLCIIGGNWIGEAGANDISPRDTFKRELWEEIVIDKAVASTMELDLLGFQPEESFYQVPISKVTPKDKDRRDLNHLKEIITENCQPFADYLGNIPKEVMDEADPQNKREGFKTILSCWMTPLDEKDWQILVRLHNKFNNLSQEALTTIISLSEIIANGVKPAFEHGQVLKDFFLWQGFKKAEHFPLIKGITTIKIGSPRNSWLDYLKDYEIVRKPI